jgi:hypothetical protein
VRIDGSALADEAGTRLRRAGLDEHIGFVDTVQRDGADVVLVEVRRELRRRLTPQIATAMADLPFRLRDAAIPDGQFFGGAPAAEDLVEDAGVIVEPERDDRPPLVAELERRAQAAGMASWIGTVRMDRFDGKLMLEVGVSARAPQGSEAALMGVLDRLPVARIFRREPRRSAT